MQVMSGRHNNQHETKKRNPYAMWKTLIISARCGMSDLLPDLNCPLRATEACAHPRSKNTSPREPQLTVFVVTRSRALPVTPCSQRALTMRSMQLVYLIHIDLGRGRIVF
ncbi:hypothetical protein AcW1_001017 [Taiwanofungus camphoratus]|nr:hypothetical protein AcW1_001017 [Antrodia cinnamomea]